MAAKKEQIMRDFKVAADPEKAEKKTGDAGKAPKGRLAALFNRPTKTFSKADLQRAFEQAKNVTPKPSSSSGQQEHTEEIDPEKLKQAVADPDKLEKARKTRADLERRQREHEQEPEPEPPPKGRDPGDRGR
jgi:hypothetical protein